jgi:predicted ester cyclase
LGSSATAIGGADYPGSVDDRGMAAAGVGRALIDAWNAHDVERIASIHSADFSGTDVGDAQPVLGREGVRRAVAVYLLAFPDIHFTVDELIAGRDHTVVVWSSRGTRDGAVMGIPPTRRSVGVSGVWVLAVRDDQI